VASNDFPSGHIILVEATQTCSSTPVGSGRHLDMGSWSGWGSILSLWTGSTTRCSSA